ncbi:MAG: hypothetical protein MRY83_06060 [Flavobacteriales bacterium]|nr:hypothetical protein [Flavobacteriales bacterium]
MQKVVEYSFRFDVPKGRAPLNSKVKVTLTVKVNKTISFEYFDLSASWAIRGLNKYSKNEIKVVRLDQNTTWTAGETVEYEFDFIPSGPISFYGKYMQIIWFLDTDIELSSESKRQLRSEYLSQFKIRKTFKPDFEYDQEKLFKVVAENPIYDCGHFESTIKTRTNPLYWIVPVAVFLFSLINPGKFIFLMILSFVGSIIGGIIVLKNRVGMGKFNNVKFEVRDYDHDFKELLIHLGAIHHKISQISFYYDAQEEVTDNRGSYSQKYEHRIMKSKVLKIVDVKDVCQVRFSLKANNVPATISDGDSQIHWYLNFKFHFKNGRSDIRSERFLVRLN